MNMPKLEESRKVAQTFSFGEKVPQYNNDIENQILLSFDEKIIKTQRSREYEILSRFERIAQNQSAIQTYKYMLIIGCSFVKEIARETGISEASAYRAKDALEELNLIVPITKVKLRRTNGEKPILWGLADVSDKEIQEASKRYMRSKNKAFKYVDQLYQRTLQEVQNEEIQYNKIATLARNMGNTLIHFIDNANQVEEMLKEKGIKVWRSQ